METLYITHPACKLHEMGPGHPECPERLDAITDQLLSSGLLSYLKENQDFSPADALSLSRVHPDQYQTKLDGWLPKTGYHEIDGDTVMNPHTLNAARYAAGAVVSAVDAVMAKEAITAFCAVRPPGHHASRDQAMGFCFYNNIAIAALHAIEKHGLQRIAIIDFDVHHGNGTEAIFAHDSRVLMCSFFQFPLFPDCGVHDTAPNMVNVPVPAYSSGEVVRKLVTEQWLPRLSEHQPELIFISAGFDAHREDDIAQLGLVEADYAWLTQQIVAVADQYAQGRVVSALEGGYNLSALGRSVVTHIKALSKL
jgi:acetoin utilization deacetylase AcuC-like enzyme